MQTALSFGEGPSHTRPTDCLLPGFSRRRSSDYDKCTDWPTEERLTLKERRTDTNLVSSRQTFRHVKWYTIRAQLVKPQLIDCNIAFWFNEPVVHFTNTWTFLYLWLNFNSVKLWLAKSFQVKWFDSNLVYKLKLLALELHEPSSGLIPSLYNNGLTVIYSVRLTNSPQCQCKCTSFSLTREPVRQVTKPLRFLKFVRSLNHLLRT